MKLTRRGLIRGGLAVPFLEMFMPQIARAGGSAGPKRLVIFKHRQGTVLHEWLPTGSGSDFVLPRIAAPLEPFRDRLVFVNGLDNRIPEFNTAGNGHQNAEISLLTNQVFLDPSASVLQAAGPSIEQVIAERITADRPYQRLDFGIGGGTAGSGLSTSSEFWYGAGDPITFVTDPRRMLIQLFGDADASAEDLENLRLRRISVLDAVQDQFASLRSTLGSEDRVRLDAHAEKIRELERRLDGGAASCGRPELSLPGDYDYGFDDDISSRATIDLLVAALSCGLTNNANLLFVQGEDPTFPWLDVDGGPVVPTDRYDNWHGMVHDGRDEEGLVVGFQWYQQQLAALLLAMDGATDPDGDNLLDTSLVVGITEFGNGNGHNTFKLPIVLAGTLGDAPMGRVCDYMNGGVDDDWLPSDHHTGQLWVSLLQAFGGSDDSFGFVHESLPTGPLPGLLDG